MNTVEELTAILTKHFNYALQDIASPNEVSLIPKQHIDNATQAIVELMAEQRGSSNTTVRQILLDLLTEYQTLEKPANPELLKLHIEAYETRLDALLTSARIDEIHKFLNRSDSLSESKYATRRIAELQKGES